MDRQPHIAARAWCTHIGSYHAGRARLSTPPKGDNLVLKPRLGIRRRCRGVCLGKWCQRAWSALNRPYEIGRHFGQTWVTCLMVAARLSSP
jgi:hypothetical protein